MTQIPRPDAIRTQADIVFCIDSTGSMKPCIDQVRQGVSTFIEGLMSAAQVNYQLRLIGYRDHHDPEAKHEDWNVYDFTSSVETFRTQLASLVAHGGGDAPESALDALYLALHSNWRPSRTHKTIILMTDADTHPTLTKGVYSRPDNTVYRVIQDFQELRHSMLFIVAPQYPIYQQLERSMKQADRKIVAHWVPADDRRYEGLSGVEFIPLLSLIGKVVSATSILVEEDG